jgi:hypothetical protein
VNSRKKFSGFTALGVVVAVAVALLTPATAAVAAPISTTCDYANANGGGKYPTSICWIDWTGFDAADAAGDGQQVTMPIGDYLATFTVTKSDVPAWNPRGVTATATGAAFPLGSPGYYEGISGRPMLYASTGAINGATNIAISDFTLSLSGTPVSGYSLVTASPETIDALTGSLGEYMVWNSDQNLTVIDHAYTINTGGGCVYPLPGDGTLNLNCNPAGAGATGAYGVIASAPSATRISGSVYMRSSGEREGIAFGIQTARASVTKVVDGRVDADDAFDITITSNEGPELASATTGTTNGASTGSVTVIPTGPLTLSDEITAGSESLFDYYEPTWVCTNALVGSTTVLPSGSDPTQTLDLAIGDDVSCEVTNAALPAELTLVKTVDSTTAGVDDEVTYTFDVTNSGDLPVDTLTIDDSTFSGSGPLGAITCLATSLAVGASTTCEATYTITQADVDADEVTNTATATAEIVGTDTEVESADSSAVIDTASSRALAVEKTVDKVKAGIGDVLTYTLTATNNGTLTLTNVTLVDQNFSGSGSLSALNCDAPQPTTLLPGETLTCTATYTVQAADIGPLDNSALASGVLPSGDVLTADDAVDVTVGRLAITGADLNGTALGLLVALGGAALLLSTRRRRARHRLA